MRRIPRLPSLCLRLSSSERSERSPGDTPSRSAGSPLAPGWIAACPGLAAALLSLPLSGVVAPGAQAQATNPTCASGDLDGGAYTVPDGWSLLPSGLSAGSTFRLLFITTTEVNAESSDIAHYNALVQTSAKAGHSGISDGCGDLFKVVGLTTLVNARQNTDSESTDTDAAIYWLGANKKVADDYADFYDGSWDGNDQGSDQLGRITHSSWQYWTGSNDDGTAPAPFENQLGASGGLAIYSAGVSDRLNTFYASTDNDYHFLAMSPVFKAPPASVTISIEAGGGGAGIRRWEHGDL